MAMGSRMRKLILSNVPRLSASQSRFKLGSKRCSGFKSVKLSSLALAHVYGGSMATQSVAIAAKDSDWL